MVFASGLTTSPVAFRLLVFQRLHQLHSNCSISCLPTALFNLNKKKQNIKLTVTVTVTVTVTCVLAIYFSFLLLSPCVHCSPVVRHRLPVPSDRAQCGGGKRALDHRRHDHWRQPGREVEFLLTSQTNSNTKLKSNSLEKKKKT
jgi:hypothetical protein